MPGSFQTDFNKDLSSGDATYITIQNPQSHTLGFPVGSVVKNPPADAGDRGSIHDLGRSHVPWSN